MEERIKVFIVNRDRYHSPRKMAEFFDSCGLRVIFLDNGSTYPPLLDWYKEMPYELELFGKNCGECCLWHVEGLMEKYDIEKGNYLVTDPDLQVEGMPKDFLKEFRRLLDENPWADKAGASIEINDLPQNDITRAVIKHESNHWLDRLPSGGYRAAIDTTLALYRSRVHSFECVRADRPYTVKHSSWYVTGVDSLPPDELYYLQNIGIAHNYWSDKIKKEYNIIAPPPKVKKTLIMLIYFDRLIVAQKTIQTIRQFSKQDNYTILIVDDGSQKQPFQTSDPDVVVLTMPDKDWTDPVIAQNRGLLFGLERGYENFIIGCSEVAWTGDLVNYTNEHLTNENYLSYPCYSLSAGTTVKYQNGEDIMPTVLENDVEATDQEHDSWYNHTIKRAKFYNFMCAVSRDNIIKLNGFDERFAYGIAYADDNWICRITRLGLKMEIPLYAPMTFHQYHSSGGSSQYAKDNLVHKNMNLHHQIGSDGTGNYKAIHTHTPDFDTL